jgi:hypothetical protein
MNTPRTIPETDNITFHCGQASQEIMRLDEDGMTYKGQRIEDGGEAHRAFLEVMSAMQPTPRTDAEITFTGAYTCTPTVSVGFIESIPNEVAELRARAERAEANETVALAQWNKELKRAMKAEAELVAEREKSERYRLATLKLDAELATERARLDWIETPSGMDWQWEPERLTVSRASIDAAMKEDAK